MSYQKFYLLLICLVFLFSCSPPTIEEQIQDLIEEDDLNERQTLTKVLADSLNTKVPEILSGLGGFNNSDEIIDNLFDEYVSLSKNPQNTSKVYNCLKYINTEESNLFLGQEIMDGKDGELALKVVLSLNDERKKEALFEALQHSNSFMERKVCNKYSNLGSESLSNAFNSYGQLTYNANINLIYNTFNYYADNQSLVWEALVTGLKLNNFNNQFHDFVINVAKSYGEEGLLKLINDWRYNENENLLNSLIELGAIPYMLKQLGTDENAKQFLAQAGKPAFSLLVSKMKSQSQEVRFAAADALVQMSKIHPSVVTSLTNAFDNESTSIIAINYPFYIRMGMEGTEDLLIRTLKNHFRKDMCLDYLNCGNSYIEDASRQIAAQHGYSVYSQQGNFYGPKWGSGQ